MARLCRNCHRGDHRICASPLCECDNKAHGKRRKPKKIAAVLVKAHDNDDRRRTGVPLTRKEDAPCCEAKRDPDGRPVLGFCGPDCIRRAERDARLGIRR